MSDVSYLLNNIPNPVVNSNFLSVRPDLVGKVYLLGSLPNNQFFLINNFTTTARNGLSASKVKPGLVIYNTTDGVFQQYIAGDPAWMTFQLQLPAKGPEGNELVKDGPGFDLVPATPILSPGDLIIGGSDGKPLRLPIASGSSTEVLTIVGGLPAWGVVAGTGVVGSSHDPDAIDMAITFETSDYTLHITDFTVCCDCTSNDINIFCPTIGMNIGQIFTIKRMDDSIHYLTINGNGKNIDSSATISISDQWDAVSIQWTGVFWIQI